MDSTIVFGAACFAGLGFCLFRAILDLRSKRIAWGIASLAVGALMLWGLMTPIKTHAVKVTLPINS